MGESKFDQTKRLPCTYTRRVQQVVFWLGILTPAAIVLAVFTTLLLIQEKAAQPTESPTPRAFSEPAAASKQEHLND